MKLRSEECKKDLTNYIEIKDCSMLEDACANILLKADCEYAACVVYDIVGNCEFGEEDIMINELVKTIINICDAFDIDLSELDTLKKVGCDYELNHYKEELETFFNKPIDDLIDHFQITSYEDYLYTIGTCIRLLSENNKVNHSTKMEYYNKFMDKINKYRKERELNIKVIK